MRKQYLIIVGLLLLCMGCVIQGSPVCRHTVVGDALFIGETYSVYQIAVDPTVSKHAQVRYFDEGKWHWYHEVEGWKPNNFYPVLYFNIEDYVVWYKARYHDFKGGKP